MRLRFGSLGPGSLVGNRAKKIGEPSGYSIFFALFPTKEPGPRLEIWGANFRGGLFCVIIFFFRGGWGGGRIVGILRYCKSVA